MREVSIGTPEPVLRVGTPDHNGMVFVEVQGELSEGCAELWDELLQSATEEVGVTGLTIDLRGCGEITADCLSRLLTATEVLRARGLPGVGLVVFPGSAVEQQLNPTTDVNGMPIYSTAAAALLAFDERAAVGLSTPVSGSGHGNFNRVN